MRPMRNVADIQDTTPTGASNREAEGAADVGADPGRAGRIGFFVYDHRGSGELPAVVRHWHDHERAMLAAARGGTPTLGSPPAWRLGAPWTVWRLLSANNRELARGVGVQPSMEAARRAAAAVIARAPDAVPTFVFDPDRAHGWCVTIDGQPVLIAPSWHQSRRTNRLNLDKALVTLHSADVNGTAAVIGQMARVRPMPMV